VLCLSTLTNNSTSASFVHLVKNQTPSNHNHCQVLAQYNNTMGVARGTLGPWSPKYIISIIYKVYKKVVLRLSEHGDVIETQTIMTYLCDNS